MATKAGQKAGKGRLSTDSLPSDRDKSPSLYSALGTIPTPVLETPHFYSITAETSMQGFDWRLQSPFSTAQLSLAGEGALAPDDSHE